MAPQDPGLAFTDGALQFAQWNEQLWEPAGRDLAAAAHLLPGQTVLDACCGAGATTKPIVQAVGPEGAVDGVDLSSGLLAMAGSRLGAAGHLNVTLTEADVTAWRGHRTYDAVLCGYSAFFFEDMAAGVEHLLSLLTPGGTFALNSWVAGALSPLAETILQAAITQRPRLAGVTPSANANMALLDSPEKMSAWLAERGLRDVHVRTIPLSLSVDAEKAWALVMGSGWRTLLPRIPEAIARVKHEFMALLSDQTEPATGLVSFNSDTLIGTGRTAS